MKGSLSSFGILIEKIYQRRNLFNDKRKKKGEREAEKSVFDKILLKKPSKILSAAEERGGKEEMKRTLITSENREQRSET